MGTERMPTYETPIGRIETLEAGTGPNLAVLVHATAAGPGSLGRLAALAADDGWRVVAPALEGYGETRLSDAAGPAPVVRNSAVVRWALSGAVGTEDIGARLLFGHSMGGLVALEAALSGACPDSLALYEPIALSLLDPNDPADQEAREMDRRLVAGLARSVEDGEPERGVAAFVEAWNDISWSALRASDRAKLTDMAPDLVRETRGTNAHRLSRTAISTLTCRAFVMGGETSTPLAHRLVAATARAVPNATVKTLPTLGHFGPVSDPIAVWRVLSSAL